MNSGQRRKVYRKTDKIVNMNTVMGYWCVKCQEFGNIANEKPNK